MCNGWQGNSCHRMPADGDTSGLRFAAQAHLPCPLHNDHSDCRAVSGDVSHSQTAHARSRPACVMARCTAVATSCGGRGSPVRPRAHGGAAQPRLRGRQPHRGPGKLRLGGRRRMVLVRVRGRPRRLRCLLPRGALLHALHRCHGSCICATGRQGIMLDDARRGCLARR